VTISDYIDLVAGVAILVLTSLRPAPMARRSLALSRSFSMGHGSPGASPLDPLVHISNPSPYTHVKSQFPCSISLDFFFFQTVQIKIHLTIYMFYWSINRHLIVSTYQSPTESCRTQRIPEDSSGLHYDFDDFEL